MNRKPDSTQVTAEELRARKVKLAEGGIVFVLVLGLCIFLGIHFARDGGPEATPVTAEITQPDLPPAPIAVTEVATQPAVEAAPAGTEPAGEVAPEVPGTVAPERSAGDGQVPPVREILPDVPELVTYSGAEQAYRDGRHAQAAAMFAVYCAEHPGNAWGHYMRGLSLWKAGRGAEAADALQDALAQKPDHLKSLVNLARVQLDLGRPEAALASVDRALDTAPDHAPALRVRGRALHELGRTDAAEASYLAALRLQADDGWALNNLALLWIEQEEFERALAPLARAAELLPAAAVVRNNLGVALERTGHAGQAAEQYALAADLGSGRGEESFLRLEELGAVGADPAPAPVDLTALAAAWTVPGEAADPVQASAGEAVAQATFEANDQED